MKPIKRVNQNQPKPSNSINLFDKISNKTDHRVPEWAPTKDQLSGEINTAIEEIRTAILNLQISIKASDKYILGLLDVVADDYRAQLPSGKN